MVLKKVQTIGKSAQFSAMSDAEHKLMIGMHTAAMEMGKIPMKLEAARDEAKKIQDALSAALLQEALASAASVESKVVGKRKSDEASSSGMSRSSRKARK